MRSFTIFKWFMLSVVLFSPSNTKTLASLSALMSVFLFSKLARNWYRSVKINNNNVDRFTHYLCQQLTVVGYSERLMVVMAWTHVPLDWRCWALFDSREEAPNMSGLPSGAAIELLDTNVSLDTSTKIINVKYRHGVIINISLMLK